MTTAITDKQRAILQAAAARPGGLAEPPAHLPPAPRGAVAKALMKASLVEPAGTAAEGDRHLAWKVDGQAVLLRLTEAGRQAIGAAAEEAGTLAPDAPPTASDDVGYHGAPDAAEAAQGAPAGGGDGIPGGSGGDTAEAPGQAPTGTQDGAHAAPADAPAAARLASTALLARAAGVRAAAAQVLTAWDDAVGERAGLVAAVDALRAAMPPARSARAPRVSGAPRAPRQGTKQEAVLALLSRAEGASGPDMIAATGWAPHTVRGFLAGLKKRGIAVLVHERVRQVGPGKEGAKGSFTVYRVAAEPTG